VVGAALRVSDKRRMTARWMGLIFMTIASKFGGF